MEPGAGGPGETLPAAGHSGERLGPHAGGERGEDHVSPQGAGEGEAGPEEAEPGAGLHPVAAEGAGGPALPAGGVGEGAERHHLHAERRRGAREDVQAGRERGRSAQEDVSGPEGDHRAPEHVQRPRRHQRSGRFRSSSNAAPQADSRLRLTSPSRFLPPAPADLQNPQRPHGFPAVDRPELCSPTAEGGGSVQTVRHAAQRAGENLSLNL